MTINQRVLEQGMEYQDRIDRATRILDRVIDNQDSDSNYVFMAELEIVRGILTGE